MAKHSPVKEQTKRRGQILAVFSATVLMLAVHALPTVPLLEKSSEAIELTADGKACLAILAFAVVLWVTEAVPFAVTALFVFLLIPLFGIAGYETVISTGFGNPIITFFIGVLILSAGFTRSGLGTRLVLHVLLIFGTRTDRVLLGFLSVGALLSMWINNMAVAALLLPLGVGLLKDARLVPGSSNFGRALMIACAFGISIGGIATPAGTGANPVAISYLKELTGADISFLQWMSLGVPASLLMIPIAWRILLRVFPPEISVLPFECDDIKQKLDVLGPPTPIEVKTLVVFMLTIAGWVSTPLLAYLTDGRINPSIHAVALLGGLALFLPVINVLSWPEAQADIEWGSIILIVAGLALGVMVYDTGAARWLGLVLLGKFALAPPLLQPFVIVLAVSLLHLMFTSNTVTSTIIMPILIALAQDIGLSVWAVAAPAAFASSLAFILVTETPANVIPYSSGYFSIKDMAKAGLWMMLGAAVCVTAVAAVMGAVPFGGL